MAVLDKLKSAAGLVNAAAKIDKAVSWACAIAADDTHKYSQQTRWGPHYDCSSFVISAYEQAGVPVKTGGATYTGNMKSVFLSNGFTDVTDSVNLKTGKGLQKGDVLLNVVNHTAMVQNSSSQTVEAKSTKSGIVKDASYRNYPWDCVLRYGSGGGSASSTIGNYDSSEIYVDDEADGENSEAENGNSEKEYHFTDKNEKLAAHPFLFNQPNIIVTTDELRMIIGANGGEELYDVTRCLGGLEWHNSLEELATSMSFNIAKPQQTWQGYYTPVSGDIVRLYAGGVELFRGTIITPDDSSVIFNKYTCYDAGRLLNKTQDTYQFSNISVRECIKKILGDLSVPIASLPDSGELDTVTVNDVYFDKYVSDILKDFIENKLSGRYNFDFVPSGFRLYLAGSEIVYPKFRVAPNTPYFESIEHRGETTHAESFDDRKTSVKVISDTDVLAVARNDEAYSKYGLIQEIVKINPDEFTGDAYQYALDKVNELGKIKGTYSFEVVEELGSYTRAGSGLMMADKKFLITNTDHTVEHGIHKTKIDIERV